MLPEYISTNAQCAQFLFKAHILTGCDVTSKIGTKNGALIGDPKGYLRDFGEIDELRIEEAELAEQYLVKVTHHSTTSKSFNRLRFDLYVDKRLSLMDMPPTSFSLAGHLLRCHYVIRQCLLLLDKGFSGDIKIGGVIVPDKQL